jgi:hypothetical protein
MPILVMPLIIWFSTKMDIKVFNSKYRYKVVTDFPKHPSDKYLFKEFLKQNTWEISFFIIGYYMGLLLGGLI